MHGLSETALYNACRILFGHSTPLSRSFLDNLQSNGVRAAFRSQAMAHHPDRHTTATTQKRSEQTARFREIRQAYDLILVFLEKRPRLRPSSHPPNEKPQSPTHGSWRSGGKRPPAQPFSRPEVVPTIFLEFGTFAYYRKKVSYAQLIEALVWQRRQRPTLGLIACEWGWLSEARVRKILDHRGTAVRFGRKAVELGYLNSHQIEALLQHQRSLQLRLGRYFIEQGLMSEAEADELALELGKHNERARQQAQQRATRQR